MLERRRVPGEPVRLLFVGGDFARKGGDLLLEVFEQQFAGMCELHLVTRSEIRPRPGVRIYNDLSPMIRAFAHSYAAADIFVLPTVADCFSLASLEAMASGLPVISTAVGGIPEIIAHGKSGYVINPRDGVPPWRSA